MAKKLAILVADGFEQVEMTKPCAALDDAGAETKIVSIKSGKVQGVNHDEKGDKFDVDLILMPRNRTIFTHSSSRAV